MDPISNQRDRVNLREHDLANCNTTGMPFTYTDFDDKWNIEKFKRNFKVNVTRLEGNEIEFEMIGIDVALANAFRRILLAEVPTMAIEKVLIYNNTSVIQDEVLAHRLGLIPICADPHLFSFRDGVGDDVLTEFDTIKFKLQVKCHFKSKDALDPDERYINHNVYSGDLKLEPIGSQDSAYGTGETSDLKPVHDDILIAKLRPGQEIDLEVHCVKGIGKDHAKFSPVATASYRLLPEITLLRDVCGEEAERLAASFSKGVIGLREDDDGKKHAYVENARLDTCSRNVMRHDDLKSAVNISRVRDHVLFSIDSTGALPPKNLMTDAITVLMDKCDYFINELASLEKPSSN